MAVWEREAEEKEAAAEAGIVSYAALFTGVTTQHAVHAAHILYAGSVQNAQCPGSFNMHMHATVRTC
jgi:hypothetical protein